MTTPDRQTDPMDEMRLTLAQARPDQIERLLRDILRTASNDDFRPTGRA